MAEWIRNAKVGDKVVFVVPFGRSHSLQAFTRGDVLPVEGEVYTIREITLPDLDGMVFLKLEEIQNPVVDDDDPLRQGEALFNAARFRPVQLDRQDISVFKRLLNTTPADLVEA